MKSFFKRNVLSALLVLSTIQLSLAQEANQELKGIKDAINKSIKLSFHKNRDLRLVLSSMYITFTEDGEVGEVIISENVDSLLKSKGKIVADLTKKINELNLDKSSFSNKYIMVLLIIGSSERVAIAKTEMPENWEEVFLGIDTLKLNGKNLKYCIPIGIEYLGTITN